MSALLQEVVLEDVPALGYFRTLMLGDGFGDGEWEGVGGDGSGGIWRDFEEGY